MGGFENEYADIAFDHLCAMKGSRQDEKDQQEAQRQADLRRR